VKFVFDNPDTPFENLTEMEGVSGSGDSGGPAFVIENDKILLIGVGSTQSTKKTMELKGIRRGRTVYARFKLLRLV
jgi:hypothetical protein